MIARWPDRRSRSPLLAVARPARPEHPAAPQPPGTSGLTPPTANDPPSSVGKGEGKLNLIAWEGYAQPQWVKPFEKQTGCQVNAKYAGSSNEMVSLMANGGGGQYDLVSASGDADLRLIYGGDVKPVNVNLVPSWKNFHPFLQSPPFNTVNGVHYGISLQCGPNELLYNTKAFPTAPTSWSVIYTTKYTGKITVPNNPIQIADAALYLSKRQPSLGITDPYELTQTQFNAAVELLKQQRPLVKKYWDLASDEIYLFENGETVVGAAWPYQTGHAEGRQGARSPTRSRRRARPAGPTRGCSRRRPRTPTAPTSGSRTSPRRRCRPSRPSTYGETPGNSLACPYMNQICEGLVRRTTTRTSRTRTSSTIKFWKTPLAPVRQRQERLRAVPAVGSKPGPRSPADRSDAQR